MFYTLMLRAAVISLSYKSSQDIYIDASHCGYMDCHTNPVMKLDVLHIDALRLGYIN